MSAGINITFRARAAFWLGSAAISVLATAPGVTRAEVGATATTQTSIQEIVVTARRRSENLQAVPVAVTVVQPKTFDARGAFTPQDLTVVTPGLTVSASTGDRNTLIYTIRGQGFAFGSLYPAVITYFDEVPIVQIVTGQFFDLDNVQVLRGPQGVLFGRVTDGGNIMINPKKPGGEFDGYFETKLGDYGLRDFTGAINIPVVPDRLSIRGAVDINRRDGFTKNLYNGQDLDNVAYESYRVGIDFKPTDYIDNYTVTVYERTHDNGTGTVLGGVNPTALNNSDKGVFGLFAGVYGIEPNGSIVPFQAGLTPLTSANYLASLQSQLASQNTLGPRRVYLTSPLYDRRTDLYVVNTTTVSLPSNLELKNIFGYMNIKDDEASSFGGGSGGPVETCHSGCPYSAPLPFTWQEQFSDELRLAGKFAGDTLNWSAGLYGDFRHPGGEFDLQGISLGILERDSYQTTQTYSDAAYGSIEYNAAKFLPGLKFDAGVRYTKDRVLSSTVTYVAPLPAPGLDARLAALGLPAAVIAQTANTPIPQGLCENYAPLSALGPAVCRTYGSTFNAFTFSAGPSYQFDPSKLVYLKVSRGYRPGGVNGTAPAGVSPQYQPEYDLSVELGAKADWNFGGIPVRTDMALYHDNYSNIQENVVLSGTVPVSVVRNVDSAIVQGVEFEGTMVPMRGLTFGVTYDYTDAQFDKDQPSTIAACNPAAFSTPGFCPYNLFAYTPTTQVGLTADYVLPIDEHFGKISFGGRLYHQTKIALTSTSALNPASIEPAYTLLDLHADWTQMYGKPVDLSFFMTNATNQLYRTGADDLTENSSVGVLANIYAPPRMFGFSIKYRFGRSASAQ